jgi:hypothetical protein
LQESGTNILTNLEFLAVRLKKSFENTIFDSKVPHILQKSQSSGSLSHPHDAHPRQFRYLFPDPRSPFPHRENIGDLSPLNTQWAARTHIFFSQSSQIMALLPIFVNSEFALTCLHRPFGSVITPLSRWTA